ncbi:MAG: hypothetical protein ACXWLV_03120, partial [Rhizomicrobium sp.]
MERWGFWDWVGYVVLGAAALIEAINTSLKAATSLSAALPSFFTSDFVGYLPLTLFVVATIVLVSRLLGWLPGKPKYLNKAELVLRYYGDHRPPVRISYDNIWRWYSLELISNHIVHTPMGVVTNEAIITTAFFNFDQPITAGTMDV